MSVRSFVWVAAVAVGSMAAVVINSCSKDDIIFDLEASGYPKEIGKLILTKCSTPGCHTTQSKDAVAGLDLSSWNALMSGDRNGAVVIPYRHDYSTLFLFSNHFDELGAGADPLMPYGREALSREEVVLMRDWIDAGAPNARGEIAFSEGAFRKKYYVTNQGCDVVTVFDQATGLQMRKINVGADGTIESPHSIRISPDGQYWYVCFSSGRYIEKYRTVDDGFVGRALLGPDATSAFGSWNTFAISPDSRFAYAVDWQPNGRVARIDLENMTWLQTYQGSGLFVQPHGSFISPDGNTLYVTCNFGNFIYKVDITIPQLPDINKIIIDGVSTQPLNTNSENGHEIIFSPDNTKYFITSERSNIIRVMDVATDQLVASIPVGIFPQEMSISEDLPFLYVTCPEDTATFPGSRGSVYIINWQTNTLIGSLYTGYQPHGVVVDDDAEMVMIAHRNVASGGPAPHHTTNCGGKNGYVTFINMNTQQLIPGKRIEVAVDPYACEFRR